MRHAATVPRVILERMMLDGAANKWDMFPGSMWDDLSRNVIFGKWSPRLSPESRIPFTNLLTKLSRRSSPDNNPNAVLTTGLAMSESREEEGPDVSVPVGYIKGCEAQLPYCQLRYDTNCVSIDSLIRRYKRGNIEEYPEGLSTDQLLHLSMIDEMQVAGMLVVMELERQLWAGTGNNKQMFGLGAQIQGSVPGSVPALVGDVKDFDCCEISSSERDIVEYLSMMMWYVGYIARTQKLTPVHWTIVMRPELWYELTAVWGTRCEFRPERDSRTPDSWTCSYCGSERGVDLTSCISCGGQRQAQFGQHVCLYCGRVYHDRRTLCWDGEEGVGCGAIEAVVKVKDVEGLREVIDGKKEFRDWMREEMLLPINGTLYEVILDHAIPERRAEEEGTRPIFWSDLHVLPMTISGGIPSLFMDYVDYKAGTNTMGNSFSISRPQDLFWTDGGVFVWKPDQCHWDYKLTVYTEQRVVLRTPQLSGIIRNVGYSPLTLAELEGRVLN